MYELFVDFNFIAYKLRLQNRTIWEREKHFSELNQI